MKNDIYNTTRLFSTKTLTRISLLIALNIILSRFLSMTLTIGGFPSVKISFSHVPLFLAGILYGPIAGFSCGFVSDYIGSMIINSGGVSIPGFKLLFSLTAGLAGMIPGLIYKYSRNRKINYIKMNTFFIAFISVCLLISIYIKNILFFKNKIFIILLFVVILIFIFLPRISTKVLKGKNIKLKIEKIYFAVSVSRIVTSVFLNTILLSILFGKGIIVFLPTRIITNFFMVPMLSIVTTIIIDALSRQEEFKIIDI